MNDIHGAKIKTRKVLQEEESVSLCYVFGSVAQNRAGNKSDIDLAVYLSSECSEDFFAIRLRLIEKFTREFSFEADVIILNTASPFLRYVVVKEGKLLMERSLEARIDFELKAMRDYFDYKPILEMYNKKTV